jgi:N-acetyltransferase
MVARRRTKTDENRSVTPDNVGKDSPRSRKCLDLNVKGGKAPLSDVNGWKSSDRTPSKKDKDLEPATPANSEIIAQTPANPTSPDLIPRTPVATGWSYANIGTPRSALSGSTRRRSLLVTPRSFSSSNTPTSKFVVPDEFRIVPSSTIKKEKSPEVILPKIQSSSFYGGTPGVGEEADKSGGGEEMSTLMSPPSALTTIKMEARLSKSKSMSEPRKKVVRILKRETSASKFRHSIGGGIKRKRDGLNKGGFGHGIKKPKKIARVNIMVSQMKARSIEIPGSKVGSTSAPSTPFTGQSTSKVQTPGSSQYHQPKLAAVLTPKTGKIAVTKDTNVDYELKGGQIVYRVKNKTPLRKSPRKNMSPMKASYFNGEKPKPPKSRRSGGKLFSPAANFMQPDSMSPQKYVPSPVKFTVSTDDDEPETSHISDLINRLGVEDEDLNGSPPPPISGASLDNSGIELSLQSGDLAVMTMNSGGGFVDLDADAEVSAYNAVQDILGGLHSTESEYSIMEIDVPVQPLPQENSGDKLFPIFYKETAQTDSTLVSSPDKNKGRRTYVCKDPKQLVLDVGQDRGPTVCLTCGAVYVKGNPEDESSHEKTHNRMNNKLKFITWRNERKCFEDLDGKILIVQPSDPKFMWKKVDDILSVVDKDLGFADPGKIRHPDKSKVFLYVCDKKVVGFTLAEAIEEAYRIIPQPDEPANTYTCATTSEPVKVGVSRIWVFHDSRKRGIASKLVDSVRNFFILGRTIKEDEYAFSDPTINGIDFASSYTKKKDFLVYR